MSRKRGEAYEKMALSYLKKNKLRYLTSNFQTKMGEIDLIMQDQDTLVFVEVRYRKDQLHGDAEETVIQRKQAKIIATAKAYLQQQDLHDKVYCRFDVIAIHHDHQIDWFKNAFETS